MPLAALVLAACLSTASLVAQSAAPAPDPLISFLTGRWEGTGTILGQPARVELEWAPVLGDRFARLTWVSQIGPAPKTQRFEGHAYYSRLRPEGQDPRDVVRLERDGAADQRRDRRASWGLPFSAGRGLGHAGDRAGRDHLPPPLARPARGRRSRARQERRVARVRTLDAAPDSLAARAAGAASRRPGTLPVFRLRSLVSTEGRDAPGRQGTTTENTQSIRGRSNEARRDAARAECHKTSETRH